MDHANSKVGKHAVIGNEPEVSSDARAPLFPKSDKDKPWDLAGYISTFIRHQPRVNKFCPTLSTVRQLRKSGGDATMMEK